MKVVSGPMNSVYPSPGWCITYSAATWLLAPGLFSTTVWAPQSALKCCARMRASISVTPPGDAGTMMVIGFDGKVCAWALETAARQADTAAMRSHDFIAIPPRVDYFFVSAYG